MPKHEHRWQCTDRPEWLICPVDDCNTMAQISTLLYNAEQKGLERGRYALCTDLLKRNAMLTIRGRRSLKEYVANHAITKNQDIVKARQVALIPRRLGYVGVSS
jgi:hypothetical protein